MCVTWMVINMDRINLKQILVSLVMFAFVAQSLAIGTVGQIRGGERKIEVGKALKPDESQDLAPKKKIAPDLEEKADEAFHGMRSDRTEKVIIQLKSDTSFDENSTGLSGEALAREVESNKDKKGLLVTDLAAVAGTLKKSYDNLGFVSAELPLSRIRQLSESGVVAFVSPDRPINALGHVNNTTGADAVRTQTNATGGTYTLDGSGIGIAVIDSGMFSGHKSFSNAAGATRIKLNKDFTGENRTDDPFGHGTHVAAGAAGYRVTGTNSNLYEGIAWNANLINLRVLNSQGTGTTSALLGALNWVLTNRTAYNIRVVNISLGTPAINSYKVDPICLAVRSLVNAGVVVVAAAGNDGKSASGQKQYGTIHSPGNEPSALTVGASNSFGTDMRADDIVTTYSSRGPTRSYTTDTYGVKHYDNIVKPDLVAPGNKLVFAESDGNLIVATYPNLDRGAAKNNYRYMYMSGSSMSTPITAGAAALVLQANPNLRPNMVKMILTYTAQQLAGYNTLEQGAGQLNIEGAIRLANAIKTTLPSGTALGTSMLTSGAPTAQSTVAGTTFPWAGGMILDQSYGRGTDLITKYQKIYDLGVLVGDGTTVNTSGVLVGDLTKVTNGVLVGDSIKTSNGVLVGDGTFFMYTQPLFSLGGTMLADGVLVGDGVLISDGVLVGDGVLIGDTIDAEGVLVNGDNTACMN